MTSTSNVGSPDRLTRNALFAVEVIDPVSLTRVSGRLIVRAEGLTRAPIVNLSGRFVFQPEADRWPSAVIVEPSGLPFQRQVVLLPPRPDDLARIPPEARLTRVWLRPTPAYPFDAGVTAVRGVLYDADAPMAAVRVQLAAYDEQRGAWWPEPPRTEPPRTEPEGGPLARSPAENETDVHGSFCAFVRLLPGQQTSTVAGLLSARLQFTRMGANAETRVTPETYEFVLGAPSARLPEGQLLRRDLSLDWSRLVAL